MDAIASCGEKHMAHLKRILYAYKSVPLTMDIIALSAIMPCVNDRGVLEGSSEAVVRKTYSD
jgi:hypothetical protein